MTGSALVVLTPVESKRLIAKAVAALPIVLEAQKEGYIMIGGGTTNAYVVEELTGRQIPDKTKYTAGIVYGAELAVTPEETRIKPVILKNGVEIDADWKEILNQLGPRDVFIKGANAIDAEGNAGVLVANPTGGTIGQAWGLLTARGVNLIMPVGLEKMVPSVHEAARNCAIGLWDHVTGLSCGMIPVSNALIITELEALATLFGVHAVHVASGGQGDGQGAVVIALHGTKEDVDLAFDFIQKEIKV
ncbi:MAG: hypothetical protein GX058_08445 [Firmicutes bacterium]|nr:hypothetical protein [Bacillota bacterium]